MHVCIIPARRGSKRIPGKNIKNFSGIPVIGRAIQTALKTNLFEKVLVSTDCPEIANISKQFGAVFSSLRPEELADDTTATKIVIAYEIRRLLDSGNRPEYVCCLYPTTPLLTNSNLIEASRLLQNLDVNMVVSVARFRSPPSLAMQITPEGSLSHLFPEFAGARTQNLKKAYYDAGQFYYGTTESWLDPEKRKPSSGRFPYILNDTQAIDIDTVEDWDLAEKIFNCYHIDV